jgi:hypothetical protein
MRAADADRERVVAVLQEAFAQGRITVDEFQERSDQAYASKTLGDLAPLTADLPAHDLTRPTGAVEPSPASGAGHRFGSGSWSPAAMDSRKAVRRAQEIRAIWSTWVTVTIFTTVIWLLAGTGYFWPIWPIGFLGAGALARTINGSGHQQGHQHGPDRHRNRDG